tara:strand:- start:213 stop:1271 length:1059 start_codon:yes stop_codon:yes gene_type:complete
MKILYCPIIYECNLNSKNVGDYQSDTLFHGLRSLLGEDVVDCAKLWHLYDDADDNKLKDLWGKGFTTYGLLPDLEVDRDDIGGKIRNKYYDMIVCPIHHTEINNPNSTTATILSILSYYDKKQVAIVDGWDRQPINAKLASLGVYFKRELAEQYSSIAKPISFSLPKEKIREEEAFTRQFDFAPLVPAYMHFDDPHQKTYIYDTEDSYYDMYSQSYFAYTCKKAREDDMQAGWDCMRHYEILACGSIPYFTDIEKCPTNTLFNFPKDLCVEAKKLSGLHPGTIRPYNPQKDTFIGTSKQILPGEDRGYIDRKNFDFYEYTSLLKRFREYTEKHLTTEAMAKYFLSEMKKCSE